MKRISSIVGLAAITANEGTKIGNVEQVFLHAGGRLVQGLMVKPKGLLGRRCFIRWNRIRMIGEVSVIAGKTERPPEIAEQELTRGQVILDTAGVKLGWVSDIVIDEKDGRVLSVEMSQGYWDDFTKGRTLLNDFTVQPCGVIAVNDARSF